MKSSSRAFFIFPFVTQLRMLGVRCVWDSSWSPEMGRAVEKAPAETPVLKGQLGKMWAEEAWSHKTEDSIFALILIFQACSQFLKSLGGATCLWERKTLLCGRSGASEGQPVLWGNRTRGSGTRWGPSKPVPVMGHRMFWVWRDLKGHLVPSPLQ